MSKKHQQPKTETNPTAPSDAKAPGATESLTPETMGSEARIQHLTTQVAALQDSLKRETARADAAALDAKEVETILDESMALHRKVEELTTFRSAVLQDLGALDELARGTNPNLPVTTEMGQHLLKSIQDLLRVIDVRREQALVDEPPESGWSSPRAKELVEKVAPRERQLLLGDILALLAPHVGETGTNETAADVLRRALDERARLTENTLKVEEVMAELEKRYTAMAHTLAKTQAAMVARRAPDAGAGEAMEQLRSLLGSGAGLEWRLVEDVKKLLAEVTGFRTLLSPSSPMVAVAVRDDSTASLAERYALGVLEWDGKRLNFEMLEGPARPWSELVRLMKHTVDTRLVPPTFR